jgi:hypothetical protein
MKHMVKTMVWTLMSGLLALSAGSVQAASSTNGLVSNFAIVGMFSPTNGMKLTTNSSGTVITQTVSTKQVKITSADLLNLVKTDFNTNLPAGAQLALSIGSSFNTFVVLDKNGGVFLDLSSNPVDSSFHFTFTNGTYSSLMSGKYVQTKNTVTTNMVQAMNILAPDYHVTYKDGYGNDFSFSGLLTGKMAIYMDSTIEKYTSISLQLTGFGSGTFYNHLDGLYDDGVFTQAGFKAAGKNIVP